MGHEFQQRWEFRRTDNDFDSSSNESKSSSGSEPRLKKHKLVSSLISHENDETSDSPAIQKEVTYNPEPACPAELIKSKRGQRGKAKKKKVVSNEVERGTRKGVNRKKAKYSECEPAAALDDVKVFMESLVEELKVKRENLLVWMRGEMENLVENNTPRQPTEENIQGQHWHGYKEIIEVHDDSDVKITMQHQKNLRSNMKARNCIGDFSERLVKSSKEANPGKLCQEREVPVDYGQSFKLIATENAKRERLVLSANPNSQFNLSNQNVLRQHCTSSELGGETQISNRRSAVKALEHRNTVESDGYSEALAARVDYGQITRSMMSTEKDKGEMLVLPGHPANTYHHNVRVQNQNNVESRIASQNYSTGSLERSIEGQKKSDITNSFHVMKTRADYGQAGLSLKTNYSSSFSNQVASSMYLTLPTVLTNPQFKNNGSYTSLGSCSQPIIAGDRTSLDSERVNLMTDANAHCGYFPYMQKEERIGSSSQPPTGYKNIGRLNQNRSPASKVGTGFPLRHQEGMVSGIPSQANLENLQRDNNSISNRMLNGGVIQFSGLNHTLSEHYAAANNLHSQLNHNTDGRLAAFQNLDSRDGRMFPK